MNSPKLRFKNFNDEWKTFKIQDTFDNISIKNCPNMTILTIIQGHGTIPRNQSNRNIIFDEEKSRTYKMVNKKDFIIHLRSFEGGLEMSNHNGIVSPAYTIIRGKDIVIPLFFKYYFRTNKFINSILSKSVEGIRDGKQISYNQLKDFYIPIPSIEEQTKIANFLSLIDRKIELQEKLVENLKLYKKGLLQKIFKNECQNVSLSNLLIEKNNKNSIGLEVCSVAVEKGVVNQVEHLGRSFSAKDTSKYNRVSYGNLVYTKSPTGLFPYGIIKQSYKKNDVAVSPLYAIYNPITFNVGVLIHSFFEYPINTNNYLHSLIQKGAKNTINISNSRFLEKSIPMPNDNSLIDKYANLIIDINDKISYETKKLQDLKTYKKGLLQKMFI